MDQYTEANPNKTMGNLVSLGGLALPVGAFAYGRKPLEYTRALAREGRTLEGMIPTEGGKLSKAWNIFKNRKAISGKVDEIRELKDLLSNTKLMSNPKRAALVLGGLGLISAGSLYAGSKIRKGKPMEKTAAQEIVMNAFYDELEKIAIE